jgi:transposase-like protein/ribosomal protein L37E
MFKGVTIKEFKSHFKTNEDCMSFLVDQKWKNGYQCSRCGHTKFNKGRQWFYKRCSSCCYDESATANTLFHRCKLSLLTTFEIAFRIGVRKKGMSTCELSKEFGCQQKTAWLLKAKLQQAMKSSEQFDLTGCVEVDEFMVGGFETGAPGRSHGDKSLVVLAVERVTDKKGKQTIGRAYAKTIDSASSKNLKTIFDAHIGINASVKTDGWRGYLPLKQQWNISRELSQKGENFKQLHTHIMNLKGWLRGIHHKCSAERLQDYLNEYHFRFNRRNFMKSTWEKLMQKAMKCKPYPYAKNVVCELST